MKIEIKKIEAVENPNADLAETVEQYRESLENGEDLSPNVGYTIKGIIDLDAVQINLPTVGRSWAVPRYERNGESVLGIFQTSTVQKVENVVNDPYEAFVHTNNSVYHVKEIS